MILLQIPINKLQKACKSVTQAGNILDAGFVIGVWASASRKATRTLNTNGGKPNYAGTWVQVSRLGMPLTNEAVVPVGSKDKWNAMTPYMDLDSNGVVGNYFFTPELALYMDGSHGGGAVHALKGWRIQSKSLRSNEFRHGKKGWPGRAQTELVRVVWRRGWGR